MQKRNREEMMITLTERDDLAEKAMKLEKQLDKIRNAPKPATVHQSQENIDTGRSAQQRNERLLEENEYLNEHVNKLTFQLREYREEVN